MARPFKYAEVAALNPGEFTVVKTTETFGKFMRRCLAHADRWNKSNPDDYKEFSFMELHDGEGFQVARVAKPYDPDPPTPEEVAEAGRFKYGENDG